MGLFIHRKYNLNQRSYNIEMKKPDCAVCTLKNTLRSEAVNAFEKNIREFKKDSMDKVYGKSFIDFTANCTISRYMYKMSIELQLDLAIPKQGTIILGKEGPTNHLVQIESFFNPVSNIEEYYLTDFDFFLGGNSFFRDGLAFWFCITYITQFIAQLLKIIWNTISYKCERGNIMKYILYLCQLQM